MFFVTLSTRLVLMLILAGSLNSLAQDSDHQNGSTPKEVLPDPPIDFQLCTESNNYLEGPNPKYLGKGTLRPPSLPQAVGFQACIHHVMNKPSGTQLLCEKASDSRKSADKRGSAPCPSRELVTYLSETLAYVSHCSGVDPKELFSVWAHESRFSPIAVSGTGAGGIAQLTGPAVAEVNDKLHRFANSWVLSDDPSCRDFRSQLTPMEPKQNTCARIVMPPNPAKNMVFGAIYYRSMLRAAEGKLEGTRWKSLSGEDRKLVIREFARAMYNGGQGTVGSKIDSFLAENPTVIRPLKNFVISFREHLGKQTEYGRYSEKIDQELKDMRQSPKKGIKGLTSDQVARCSAGADL
jgi:hypothetical protein